MSKLNKVGKILNIGGILYGTVKIGKGLYSLAENAINASETYNLFAVSMEAVTDEYGQLDEASSKYYVRAMRFQDEMNQKLLTNKVELMEYQANYFSMLKNQIGNDDKAYEMSENLVKAGYDIASLKNLDISDAMNKLKSGLAGQVESLRTIGIDVSESALKSVLDQVGIDRNVQQLSYAEKEVARYIAIMQQASEAQGDFAKTMDQPANQIRMFKNQLAELKQAVGSFLMGALGNILTYVTAIVMTIKEVLNVLGEFLGFKIVTPQLTSGLNGAGDAVDNIATGIGNASKNAKEFNKQILKFDEINNITPPSSSSGGSGGGASSGVVDSKLFDAMKEWDNMLDQAKSKATEIRDKMLEWLGFHRNDKGGWELNEGLTNIEKILEVVEAIGLAIATWTISSKLAKILTTLTGGNEALALQFATGFTLAITGFYLLYKGVNHLLDGDIDLFTILETIGGGLGSTVGIASMLRSASKGALSWKGSLGIGLGLTIAFTGYTILKKGLETKDLKKTIAGILTTAIGTIPIAIAVLPKATQALTQLTDKIGITTSSAKHMADTNHTLVGSFAKVTAGLAGLVTSLTIAHSSMEKYAKDASNSTEATISLLGSLGGATASGALMGSTFGPIGTVIGGISGFAIAGISALDGYNEGLQEVGKTAKDMSYLLEESSKIVEHANEIYANGTNTYKEKFEVMQQSYDSTIKETNGIQALVKELENMIDSNGKVISGYENRVDIILGDLSRATGIEFKRNEEIITKNGEVVGSYKEIQKSIAEYIRDVKKSAQIKLLEDGYLETLKAKQELIKTRQDLIDNMLELQSKMNDAQEEGDKATWDRLNEEKTNIITQIQETDKLLLDIENKRKNHSINMLAIEANLTEEQQKEYDFQLNLREQSLGRELTIEEEAIEKFKILARDNVDGMLEEYERLDSESQQVLLSQITTIDNLSPKLLEKWTEMAKKCPEAYIENLEKLDTETKGAILKATATTNGMTSELASAFYSLAEESETEFYFAIKDLSPDTQASLLDTLRTTNSFSPQMNKAFSDMAFESIEKFEEMLSKLDPITQEEILKTIATTQGFSINNQQVWETFAKIAPDAYNKALDTLDDDTKTAITQVIDVVDNEKESFVTATSSLSNEGWEKMKNIDLRSDSSQTIDTAITGIKDKQTDLQSVVNTFNGIIKCCAPNLYTVGWNTASGLIQGLQDKISAVQNAVSNIASNILRTFKNSLNIHSPSRVMAELGGYVSLGIAEGIDAEADSVYNSMKQLSKGIEISADEGVFNAVIGVDKQIQEKVKTQTTGDINLSSNVMENMQTMFDNAMQNITVTVEAKTEEGVIVKKAVQGIRDYQKRTGEMPFDLLV